MKDEAKSKQIRWTPHQDPYLKYSSNFKVSYMNNTKWCKVLTAIASSSLNLKRSEWKFIDSDHIYQYTIPTLSVIKPTHIADGSIPPVEYKWIEWIRFPRIYKPKGEGFSLNKTQDISSLIDIIKKVGQFQIEEDEEGITIFGYSR